MFVPAGYTYFGQFVDHDLTRDTTSTFDGLNAPTNQRTPRFDLDCVYGKGPVDDAAMYDETGVFLKLGGVVDPTTGRLDLLRDDAGTAIIGDPRNDENSIVSQIQAGMIRFHNRQAQNLAATSGLAGAALFNAARNRVRWSYQRTIVDDYLRRIIDGSVIRQFDALRAPDKRGKSTNDDAFVLYEQDNRAALPIEFAGAAYRFGHSLVRNGYILQDGPGVPIFDGKMDESSLIGFQPLIQAHVIRDWSRFFPNPALEQGNSGETFRPSPGTAAGAGGINNSADDAAGLPRLQFAYRIDTSIVNPLASLPAAISSDPPPSLVVRNLWRGAAFELPFGQDFEEVLHVYLDKKYLVVRSQLAATTANGDKQYQFVPIDPPLQASTPLWFYILAEAQRGVVDQFGSAVFSETDLKQFATKTGTQLGPVGGRIVLEVFHGLLDSDSESYRNHPDAANWNSDPGPFRVWNLIAG
jgi:hypothetical protein